jgi:hypothetical protein
MVVLRHDQCAVQYPVLSTFELFNKYTDMEVPVELIRLVALVAGPFTSRSIRCTCRALSRLVTDADLLWAEAGWRLSRHGAEVVFGWALYKTGSGRLIRSLARTMASLPADVMDRYQPLTIALGSAVVDNDIETAKLLLELGADKMSDNDIDGAYSPGRLLITAASKNFPDMIKLLLGSGIDVNALQGKSLYRQSTALSAAAERGAVKAVDCLLAAGAEDRDGSALSAAASYNQMEVIRVLLRAGRAYHPLNWEKLADAVTVDMADLLIRSGFKTGLRTLLLRSASKNKQRMLSLLLGHGVFEQADLDAALDEALTRINLEAASLLLLGGADPATLGDEARAVHRRYAWLL